MKELSLHILDVAKNSVKANAKNVLISITEENDWRTLIIKDDGCGMTPDFVAKVTDPFTTTRTTRRVGLGLPLLKLAAEQAEGTLEITSSVGEEDHGTTVTATFRISHLDTVPVGDMGGTISTLVQGSPDIDFEFVWKTEEFEKELSTKEMREVLGEEIPLNTPEVLLWINEVISAP